MIYLLRHAEKLLYGEQALTQQGLIDAYHYGQRLQQANIKFDEIITSPIKRCKQTAEKIVEGINIDIPITQSKLLGDPGIFVYNENKATQAFKNFTVYEVISKLIQNKTPDGFLSLEEACPPLINDILKQISSRKSILYISHDTIIMPFIALINKKTTLTELEIINFLEGYFIKLSTENNLSAIHNIL